ncbi:hypothetical protein ACOZ4B_20695 (plasmid) [Haloferax prahovense]|uniref:hypothetical protein n=1 Tax=Haloferax prahovense TaxID=381852 RepID=UPI003C725143
MSLDWLLSKDRIAAIPKATGDHVAEKWTPRRLDLAAQDITEINAIDEERQPSRASRVLMIHDEPMP